ncbi:MAG TPA: VWA domain-containing protein [Thermoanaerobaculia bacterium]|nr:VWA domain-containing protein [Thermoanaerobaculia bacterium]
MRKLLAALFLFAFSAAAQDIAVRVEPLGDTDAGVVTRVTFRFLNGLDGAPEASLSIQGSFLQDGRVIRNFRLAIPEDRPQKISTIQTFPAGNLDVEVRLIQDNPGGEALVLQTVKSDTLLIEKTGKPYVAGDDDGAEAVLAEGVAPEKAGSVRIQTPQRDVAVNLFIVSVDVEPPVTRVEFFVEGKKVMARNNPPYRAELDLGKLPKRVEVRVVGYDKAGRYVDADAFVVNERDTPLEVKITRTETPDAVSHFKLSVMNPKGTNIRTIALFAGDKKLIEWKEPPYALDLPAASLKDVEFVRAQVIDETGYEASDLLFMNGNRYMETMDVDIVELPVSVSDRTGAPVPKLEAKDFTILENGKPQKIENFAYAADLPISVGVLIDHSTSMEKRLDDAKNAAIAFFQRTIRKGDRAFIAPFASDPARNTPFVSEVPTLELQVNAIPKAGGSTALYDAIVTGLYKFRNVPGRKALIVLTDGEDTSSRVTWNDMLAYARASRVPLYFIGIGHLRASGPMRTLADETGGLTYFARSSKVLNETYAQLEKDLRTQYLISYSTEVSKNDQAYRTIEVKVDRPDANVRTIRGYLP